MNRTVLEAPPNPASYGSITDWADAHYRWAKSIKARIETDSTVNTQPIAPFSVVTYTATQTVTGTDALSNFVATLVAAMQSKGFTAPVSQRLGT